MGKKPKITGEQLNEKLLQLLQREGELKKSLTVNTSELEYLQKKQIPRLEKMLINAREEIEQSRNKPVRIKQLAINAEEQALAGLEKTNALEQQYRSKIDRIKELLNKTQDDILQIRENSQYQSFRKKTSTIGKVEDQATQMAKTETIKEGYSMTKNPIKYKNRFQQLKAAFKKKLLGKQPTK